MSMLADWLPELGAGPLTMLVAATLVAGLARGFSGFGTALIFMPLASTAMSPQMAAPLLLSIDMIASTPLIFPVWRQANHRNVFIMLAGALVGVPAGVWALKHSDAIVMRWIIIVLILAMLPILISGWRMRRAPSSPLTLSVGVGAGFLGGLAQTSGPPVVAYWLGQAIEPQTARANLFVYFGLASLITLVSYLIGGLFSTSILKLVVLLTPVYFLGVVAGARMFHLASERAFRVICYVLIALAGVISMPLLDGVLR